MNDTPRLTIETPTGAFPVGDPRAAQAIADFVRSDAIRDLTREHINELNAALVVVPVEGVCISCHKRLPMFLFDCQHWAVYGFSHSHALWLCVHCRSRADELAEDGKCICDEFAHYADDWNPFTIPTPGTQAWKTLQGPVGKVRSFGPDGREVTA